MQETPKPTSEVAEEVRETLHVLELDRTPRPEKLRRERAFFDGAHEVRFTERTFRPRHPATLDEIRNFVDSLEVKARPSAPLPPPPAAPEPVVVPPKVAPHYREAIEPLVRGALVSVETVHRIGTATVVDAAWEDATGALQRGLYLVDDKGARPYSDVANRVDELPIPPSAAVVVEPPAPMPEPETVVAPPPPEPAPEPAKKRGMLGRLRGGKEPKPAPEPAPEPAAAEEPKDAPKKRRFGFGKN